MLARDRLLRASLCLLGALGCRPEDANLGGTWNCPENAQASCFYFDSGFDAGVPGEPSLTSDAVKALFAAPTDPDSSKAPVIAYPLDLTTEPSNIYDLDIQWHRRDDSQKIFRISFESPSLPYGRYDFYTECFQVNDGCHYSVPSSPWYFNVLQPLQGSSAELTVAASDGQGGLVSVSEPIRLRVSYAQVTGGLYYWSAHPPGAAPGSPDEGTTYRLSIGARTAKPFIVPNSAANSNKCEGCHAVSGNGNVIAFTATDSLDPGLSAGSVSAGNFVAEETSTPQVGSAGQTGMNDSAMIALNEDGSLAVVGSNNTLSLRDVKTGTETPIPANLLGAEGQGYFPDFSTVSGVTRIVVTLSDHPDSPWAVTTGSIATLDFDQTTQQFSAAKVLVPMTEQEFHYYPSWSPDGNWIVFVSAPRALDMSRCLPQDGDPGAADCTGCVCSDSSLSCSAAADCGNGNCCPPNRSYDQPNSRLRVAHFPDGRVYDLNRATQAVGATSTLPKFAPAPTNGHNQLFITFNSKLPYGVKVPDNSPAQLWLSVLDFDNLPDDPSSAPVWLPFQSFGQKNHLAYWAKEIPCTSDADCGVDESCQAKACVPNQPVK